MNYMITTFKVSFVAESNPVRSVKSPADVNAVLRPIFADLDSDQEHFVLLVLNNQHRITGFKVISSGTMNASLLDMKLIFRAALALGGTALAVAHNHPGGDPKPSAEDILVTHRLSQACEMMDYRLLDHLIVTADGRFYSCKDHGEM